MDNDFILSLSFSSYSTNGLAASVAVKINNEFNENLEDDFGFSFELDDQGGINPEDFLESKMEEKDNFSIKLTLKELFGYDSSLSSEEAADELNQLPAIGETTSYCCLWKPKSNKWKMNNNSSPSGEQRGRRRSKSRGWNKLFDIFRRTKNGGERAFAALNSDDRKSKVAPASKHFGSSPMEVFYVRSKAKNEGSKRKSYLPYRHQLVGFFSATASY